MDNKNQCLAIETNLLLKDECIVGHQSRVVSVNDWNEYIEKIKSGEPVYSESYFKNGMDGYTISENASILDVWSDSFHGTCTIDLQNRCIIKKLFYKIIA